MGTTRPLAVTLLCWRKGYHGLNLSTPHHKCQYQCTSAVPQQKELGAQLSKGRGVNLSLSARPWKKENECGVPFCLIVPWKGTHTKRTASLPTGVQSADGRTMEGGPAHFQT